MSRLDDEIFEDLSATFPDMVKEPYAGIAKVDESLLKNEEGKAKWREFIMKYVSNHNSDEDIAYPYIGTRRK